MQLLTSRPDEYGIINFSLNNAISLINVLFFKKEEECILKCCIIFHSELLDLGRQLINRATVVLYDVYSFMS